MTEFIILIFYGCGLLFSVFMLFGYWNCSVFKRDQNTKTVIDITEPFVSVIMPAYNEEVTIEKVIQSVLTSSYSAFELIVIDDGSTDSTAEIIQKIKDPRLTFVRQKNFGKWSALNNGVSHSSGDYILFCDADGIFLKDSIKNGVNALLRNPDVVAVAGECRAIVEPGKWNTYFQFVEYKYLNFVRFSQSKSKMISILPGPITLIKKDVLTDVGLFTDITMVEDYELSYRLLRQNYKSIVDSSFLVNCQNPVLLSDLFKQRYRWLRGNLQVGVFWKNDFWNNCRKVFIYSQAYAVGIPLLKMSLSLLGLVIGFSTSNWSYFFVGNLLSTVANVLISLQMDQDRLSGKDFFLMLITPYTYDCFLHLVFLSACIDNVRNAPFPWRKVQRRTFSFGFFDEADNSSASS